MGDIERIYVPSDLPRWARRIFLLTLPISGPLWVAYVVLHFVALLTVVALVLTCGAAFCAGLGCIWDTIQYARRLWSQP